MDSGAIFGANGHRSRTPPGPRCCANAYSFPPTPVVADVMLHAHQSRALGVGMLPLPIEMQSREP